MFKECHMVKRVSLLLVVMMVLAGCSSHPPPSRAYHYCPNGGECMRVHDRGACEQRVAACQNSPNQVKPWLCGRCAPA